MYICTTHGLNLKKKYNSNMIHKSLAVLHMNVHVLVVIFCILSVKCGTIIELRYCVHNHIQVLPSCIFPSFKSFLHQPNS